MAIPTVDEAQKELEAAEKVAKKAHDDQKTAQDTVDSTEKTLTKAEKKAKDTQEAAKRADQEAKAAAKAATDDPKNAAKQQAAQEAEAAASKAHEDANTAKTEAADAKTAAETAVKKRDAAKIVAEDTQKIQEAAQKKKDVAEEIKSTEERLAKADGDLKSANVSPELQAQQKYQKELEDLLKEADKSSKEAVHAEHKPDGFSLFSLFDFTWKIKGCSWNIVNGDQWKIAGSEFKIVLGHSTAIHLAPKHESNYGGKYTRVVGKDTKTVVGAAITNVAGLKRDTVYGPKYERVLGAKLEHHAGKKTVIKDAPLIEKYPLFLKKFTKARAEAVDKEWKAGSQDVKSNGIEFKVLQEQTEMATCKSTLDKLVGEYNDLARKFSGSIKLKLAECDVRAPDINLKGSTKITVTSKGNHLNLASGSAKLYRGGNICEASSGQVKMKGATFKAE